MRHLTRPARLLAIGTAAAVLTACGGDDPPAADAAAADAAAPEEAEEALEAIEDLVDDEDEDEDLPFDPDAEIRPADIEVQEMGAGEVERPWEDLVLPEDFVLPATARSATWAPPEEPFDGGQHSSAGSGAFHIFEADAAEVAAFFTDRLPDQGWELEEEVTDGDAWQQNWVTRVPFDDWPEDWMADERAVEVGVRLAYLPGDGTTGQATLQFHYRAEGVSHTWD